MDLFEKLKILDINYKKVDHKAVYTVDEAKDVKQLIEGTGCKNLFITDKKDSYYLVVLEENKRADLKDISKTLDKKHLTFASEEALKEILGLTKGSVTPFGIINDKENKTILLIDKDLKNQTLLFHPNINTSTISVTFDDVIKFINSENHKYILI